MPFAQKDLQRQLIADRTAARDRILGLVRPLSGAQLNQHPEATGWSVAEVLEHLMVTAESYDDRMNALLHSARPDAGAPAREWKPTFLGNLLAKSMGSPRKFKSPSKFQPGPTPRNGVVAAFGGVETRGIQMMADAAALDWRKEKIGSPAMPGFMPKMNLGDVFRIHAIHVARHAGQVERLVKQLS